ncbi:hypothetical protein K1T71_004879 [Dendrolimus kikuchii]|uniref:Uncharacterized protein n=1 Tax=Dendrolimus kikuchii TaxID=765133 RepID=A0ACC1D705_9NEOP|nr:hypothetical protein K1T71_004879 [Dendrolimus kikuchii]
MARHRKTLALIIICLPILATVITAFRLRDLPKSHDVKKQKCESCEVNSDHTVHSVNVGSDKQLHEGPERDKHKIEKSYQYESSSDDDDDDDDDDDFIKFQFGFRKEIPKENKVELKSSPVDKVSTTNVKTKTRTSSDENDDDEDDDDQKEKLSSIIKKSSTLNTQKPDSKLKLNVKSSKVIFRERSSEQKDESNLNDDGDVSDDDDDYENKVISFKTHLKDETSKKVDSKLKYSKVNEKTSRSDVKQGNNENEEDDDEDDDNDEKLVLTTQKKNIKLNSHKKDSKDAELEQNIEGDDNKLNKLKKLDDSKVKVDKTKIETKPKEPIVDTKSKDPIKSIEEILKFLTEDESEEDDSNIRQQSRTHIFPIRKSSKDKKQETVKKSEKKDTKDTKKIEKKSDATPKLADMKKVEPVKKETKTIETKDKLVEKKPEAKKTDKTIDKEKSKTPLNLVREEKKDLPVGIKSPKESEKKQKESDKEPAKSKTTQNKVEKEKKQADNKSDKKATIEKVKDDKLKEDPVIAQIQKETKVEFDKKRFTKEHGQRDKSSKEKLSDSEEASSKTESHLKHVTDALQRKNLLKSEFEDFYAFFPTFAPNYSRIHNPECRRHGQIVLRQLRGTKLWALNMLDATAKIPSGVLQGNGIQLGDFDQCLASRARVQLDTGSVVKVQGKYCLARIDVKAEHPELEAPVHLAQAKNLLRGRIDDPGHFVPRFSTLNWGVCVPSPCNPEDVEMVLKDAVKHYQHTSGVAVRVKVDEQDCQVEKGGKWWEDWLEIPTLVTLSFYGVIILLVFAATVQDFVARREPNGEKEGAKDHQEKLDVKEEHRKHSDGFLAAFSLYRTVQKLLAPGMRDEIACIHGVRGIATIALLVAHKFLPVAAMPYTNRLKITEMVSSPVWSWCRAGWMFTDCFLLLSGTLTAYRIATNNESGALKRLLSRYLRLTPALLAVVLFYAYVWDNITTGPMWGTWVTKNAQICKDGWWWNLLYVQNYFGFENMCAPQTHQLALDMQLTVIGGMLVWAVQTKQGFFRLLLPGLHIYAAYSRYTTVRDHRLTLLAYHGVSVSQLYRTARLSYSSTLHRSTPYLIGLGLGLILVKPKNHGKFILTLGWVVSILLWSLVWWAGWDAGSLQYHYSATFAAQYAALAPLASAIAVAWVIYAVNNGSCGLLSQVLCCRPLVFISRLSYAVYLCQFIIFITNVATVKTSSEFTLMSLIDFKEISSIILASVVLTLTFITPMQSIHKLLFFESKEKRSPSNPEIKDKLKLEPIIEQPILKREDKVEPQIRRQPLLAHREVLEEIPEVEVEYEIQREKEGLDEILEEEEGDYENDSQNTLDDDLEIIEEEGGEDEAWDEREYERRPISREDDRDLDEWEWTANGNGRNGAQYLRYAR